MDTVQLLFRTVGKAAKKDEDLLDKVQSYLAALMHNGQIVGDHTPMAKVSGGILVTASLPEADALGDRFANKWVRKSLRELSAAGVDRPKVTHLGADPESRKPCRCRNRPFLIIFTTFLNAEPPLRCGTCFDPVALYKVPATNEAGNHQDVLSWEATYQAMDWLFIGTGPGERFAHDQLSRFDSGGFGELVAHDLPLTNPLRADVDEILKAVARASTLTRQLLSFSRKQVLRPELVDVNRVVSDLEPMLRRLVHEDIELRTGLGSGLGFVRVDRNQLEQVLLNLAINAKDAMPHGGVLTINTARGETNRTSHERRDGREGGYVVLEVSDTGVGMDAQTRAHLFEPFFTAREPGKGTGLGLATVHGIVEQSGGFISVHTEPHHGTSFKVFLPRLLQTPPVTAVNDRPVTGGHETILVVEDDATIRALAHKVLTKWGYSVLVAANGVDAVRVAVQDGRAIDLLLTDVVMPSRSGRAVAEHIRRQHANARVLYMSGYPDDTIAHHGVLDPATPFLQKPFTPDALLTAVRSALNGEGR